jgi:hypothetical protein
MSQSGEPPKRVGDEEWSEYVAGFEIPRYEQRLSRTRLIHRLRRIKLRPIGIAVLATGLILVGAYYILRP